MKLGISTGRPDSLTGAWERPKDPSLTRALDQAALAMTAASAEALRIVALHDEQRLWERDGATSMTGWLAARYGLARSTAAEWVRVARKLRELPGIADAYADGRLSWDQLRPLTRFATPETDEYWARKAPEFDATTRAKWSTGSTRCTAA
jgi:hypothetical protein